MQEITLNKDEFKLFNQDDQFGFFYDDMGFPKDDADATFNADVDELFRRFECIIVNSNDDILGLINEDREIYIEGLMDAFNIALEVKES